MSYSEARERYAAMGIDTDAAIAKLRDVPVSLHCWQGDDVRGFDGDPSKPLTGGIQTTGNYPGRARSPRELMDDLDMVLSLIPGRPKMNLHACYAIFDEENGGWVDRDRLEPKHFAKWVEFCRRRGLGCDFNPTFFSHEKCDPLTLSSPNEDTRKFWIDHGRACIRISQYLAQELGQPCVMNIWTGDGFKDIPGDRMGPRMRYRESIDAILAEPYDFSRVKPCVESKVFGIGVEAYTAGSAEFSLLYAAANRDKCIPLMDNGHYHPTEVVSDKIPALLTFFPESASSAKSRCLHDGFYRLYRVAAPGNLHIFTPGAVQQLLCFVGQKFPVGIIHQFQLFQAVGQVIVPCGQPCGGGVADLVCAEAGVLAPVQQLGRLLHCPQGRTGGSDGHIPVNLIQNGQRQHRRHICRGIGGVGGGAGHAVLGNGDIQLSLGCIVEKGTFAQQRTVSVTGTDGKRNGAVALFGELHNIIPGENPSTGL